MSWAEVKNKVKKGSFIKYFTEPEGKSSLQSFGIIKDNYNVISNDNMSLIIIRDFFTGKEYFINKEQIIGETFSKSAFLIKVRYDYDI